MNEEELGRLWEKALPMVMKCLEGWEYDIRFFTRQDMAEMILDKAVPIILEYAREQRVDRAELGKKIAEAIESGAVTPFCDCGCWQALKEGKLLEDEDVS